MLNYVSQGYIVEYSISITPSDSDGDLIEDSVDNCTNTYNFDQVDVDGDSIGDLCDPDIDNDGVPNALDNCLYTANADQADLDGETGWAISASPATRATTGQPLYNESSL